MIMIEKIKNIIRRKVFALFFLFIWNYSLNKLIPDEGCWCELCDIFLQIPVTYHMRIVHPGCGKPSKGKGYNSIGVYCEGWAGNCGEGGQGASSWYLMCDKCREKCMGKSISNLNNLSDNMPSVTHSSSATIFGPNSNNILSSELFSIMKENSLFLLELNSRNGT